MVTNKKRIDKSIFKRYYEKTNFVDKYNTDKKNAVDVIIPVIHSNELWEVNLLSIYREIPVNRLLIGDGGCVDDTIKIAKKFPRVKVYNHKKYKSLGYSIRKLIESVETEWFVYPHSDIFVPENWFKVMKKNQSKYDWFGCAMKMTVLAEFDRKDDQRPYFGCQMGRKQVFEKGLKKIDDDYIYRQEEYVFSQIAKEGGGKEGKVNDTFHYHQLMVKESPWSRKIKNVSIEMDIAKKEERRTGITQVKGIIKYLKPTPHLVSWCSYWLAQCLEWKIITWKETQQFIEKNNPVWEKHLKRWKINSIRVYIRSTQSKTSIIPKIRKLIKV